LTDPRRYRFVVAPEHAGKRLDQVIAAQAPELSRRRARIAIDLGGVFVDRQRMKVAGRPMRVGEEVTVVAGHALEHATKRVGGSARTADEGRLPPYQVVFEDDAIIVVDKPAGLLSAPTPESDRNNLAGLLSRRGMGREEIFVVHRLDLATSGLMVFARTADANRVLSERFREHALEREYLTVVSGAWPDRIHVVDRAVAGRKARTHVRVEERLGPGATLLRCRLETGRQHQIRIHCAAVGRPVLGDDRYGRATPHDPPRIALHATRLGLPHPVTGADLVWESPWPVDLAPWLDRLRVTPPPAPPPPPAPVKPSRAR
jgi:23S rRNA pseudouridine1911/1915/1917 synthase